MFALFSASTVVCVSAVHSFLLLLQLYCLSCW